MFLSMIRRCRRRLWLGRFTGALVDVLAFSLFFSVAFGTLAHEMGWGSMAWGLFALSLGAGLLAYLTVESLRGLSLKAVAIRLDREMGFADRISSALEFLADPGRDSFRQAHLEEAALFLRDKGKCAVAIPWPRRGRAFVLFLVIAMVALFPHTDRLRVEHISKKNEQIRRVKAAKSLVQELAALKRQAQMNGLRDLADAIADAERAMEEELRILREEDLKAPEEASPNADQKGTSGKERVSQDASRPESGSQARGKAGQGPRLSSSATYQPVGKFDSFPDRAYRATFGKLDRVVVEANMSAEDIKSIARHVASSAKQVAAYGQEMEGTMDGLFRGYQGADDFEEAKKTGGFRKEGLGLHMKAFGEFLNRYASHLDEKAMGKARLELSKKENESGAPVNLAGPPPKDGKFAVKGVSDSPGNKQLLQGTPEQMAQVAAQAAKGEGRAPANAKNANAAKGQGTSPGGKGAGTGGAGQRAAPVAMLPKAEGGEYLPLEGKLGDGEAILQIIDAQGKRNIAGVGNAGKVSYRDVFVEYAKGAEAELNGERVPLQMREYIRAYFRSIRPEAREAGAKENKGQQ